MTNIREQIVTIINQNIENANLSLAQADDELQLIGMDSMIFIKIIVNIEDTFNIEIPDSYLSISEMNTINKICKVCKIVLDG